MRPQEGEQILAELHPEPQVVRLWFFTRLLLLALVLEHLKKYRAAAE